MDREDIIRMAREAGCIGSDEGGDPNGLWEPKGHENVTELMMKFAALVAAEKEKQIIDILERLQERNDSHNYYGYAIKVIAGEI